MNIDKLKKIISVLLVVFALVAFSVGKLIFCAIAFFFIAALYLTTGNGDYNERNLYDKKVEDIGDLDIDKIYKELKDVDTPLGKCWRTQHQKVKGPVLVFGPSVFKDYILIHQNGDSIDLSVRSDTDALSIPEGEGWRVDSLLDTANLEVTPKRYSGFVGYKEACIVMADDLVGLIERVAKGGKAESKDIDMFSIFHYNSADTIVWDMDGNSYAKTSSVYDPLSVIVYDMEGREVASVTGDSKKEKAGFKFVIDGEEYGTLYRDGAGKNDAFHMDCKDGEIRVHAFQAVRRANVSSNYIVEMNGERKAILASSARIDFETFDNNVENDVIVSFDDAELLIYILINEFITTHNRFVR